MITTFLSFMIPIQFIHLFVYLFHILFSIFIFYIISILFYISLPAIVIEY